MAKINQNAFKNLEKRVNKGSSGVDMYEFMKQEARLLKECIDFHMLQRYLTYEPSKYVRTKRFENSYSEALKIKEPIIEGRSIIVSLYFDSAIGTYPSIFNGDSGFIPILHNYGWKWKKYPNLWRYLSHFEGYHFVEKGIEDYRKKSKAKLKIKVRAEYHGELVAYNEW